MRGRKSLVVALGVFVLGVFVFATMYSGLDFKLTGYAIFGDGGESEFGQGAYDNVEFNNTGVMLKYWNIAELELPDNKGDDGYVDMSGNVLLMHMNEASGTIEDSSGENNGGTYNGDLYSQSGKLSTAIGFDGIDDYVNLGDNYGFERTDNFSIESWFKTTSSGAGDVIISKIILLPPFRGWVVDTDGGAVRFILSNTYPGNDLIVKTSNTFNDNAWHNVVVVYTGNSAPSGVNIYVDGVSQSLSIVDDSLSATISNSADCSVGSRDNSLLFWGGSLDELAIWNRSLSVDEILEIYQRQKADVGYGGGNSGTYTSQVFDAGNGAVWNNISWVDYEPGVEMLFAVDGNADVWGSIDRASWSLVKDDYTGADGNGATYMVVNSFGSLFSVYNQDLYSSTDSGVSWSKINDDINGAATNSALVMTVDSNDYIYIIDGSDRILKSIDSGVSFSEVNDSFGAGPNAGAMVADSNDDIFIVDNTADVWKSTDSGASWSLIKDDYNGGNINDVSDMFVNSLDDLFVLHNQDLWKSTDSGITWTLINDDYNGGSDTGSGQVIYIDSEDNVYVADGSEDIYQSTDLGVSFTRLVENMNGGNGNIFGLSSLMDSSSLTYSVRSCDDSVCSGESWVAVSDPLSLGLSDNRYFQYKVDFVSPNSSITPTLESVNIDYTLINTAPTITIASPQDGASYGYNESLALDFSASDVDDNIDSCWYNLNAGNNVILASCANTTIDVPEGSNTLVVYVNDTQGEQASDSVVFNVQVGAPTIVLSFPVDEYLNYQDNIEFDYTPTDVDLESCWLLGDFTGVYGVNQTDDSPTSGSVNNFYLDLSDGEYLWNIGCNDSRGNSATNGNKTFYVDTTNPEISISEPSGQKTSRTGLPLSFSVSDDNLGSCWYNVYRGDAVEVANTSVDCSGSATFEVTVNADFVFNLFVNDSAGNLNSTSSNFSVDSSTAPVVVVVPSTGSSGGGSSFIYTPSKGVELEVENISVIVSVGDERTLLANVKNVGGISANKCSLVSNEGYEDYFDSSVLSNIGVGEIVEFMFVLSVLDGDVSNLDLSVECLDNVSAEVPLDVNVWRPDLDVSIVEISFGSDKELLVAYNIEPVVSSSRSLFFRVFNSDGGVVAEVSEDVELVLGEIYSGEVAIDISEAGKGMLKIAITSEDKVSFVEEDFVYGGVSRITGFALFDLDPNFYYIGIILLLFLVVAVFLVVRIWKLKKGHGMKLKKK